MMQWLQPALSFFVALSTVSVSAAELLGSYTFNDPTGGTGSTVGNLLNPSSVASGTLSALGINTSITYAGANNVPPVGDDGYGFGVNSGERVMFWRRADSGFSSTWGTPVDSNTTVANAGMHFTLTANAGFDLTVTGVRIEATCGPNYINTLQVAGATVGVAVTSSSGDNAVALSAPVDIPAGTSRTFTILWNSGGFGQNFCLDQIDVLGTVVRGPLGVFSFNDRTGSSGQTVGNLLNASAVASGATISSLELNRLAVYAGNNNVPPNTSDGFGFGNNSGEQVLFWRRAPQGVVSSWGPISDADTSLLEAGMSFTVTADTSHDLTIEHVTIDITTGSTLINGLQLARAPSGPPRTSADGENSVTLASPVRIAAGTSETLTLQWNNSHFGENYSINQIDIHGSISSSAVTSVCGGAHTVLRAVEYGLVGDGVTDDGPAIASLVTAAINTVGPVTLVFPPQRDIYVGTSPQRYVLPLDSFTCLAVMGGNSTFYLAADLRLMKLTNSDSVLVRDLQVDFAPLPFVEGTITNVDQNGQRIFVDPFESLATPINGGPTGQDGEQTFFALIWTQGTYSLLSENYTVANITTQVDGTLIVEGTGPDSSVAALQSGEATISIPVPGIAHRFGPGALVELFDNHNIAFEGVEVWSAPWFAFRIFRTSGFGTFDEVHVRPKPGSIRICSSWRDGFHAKGNSAQLRWNRCDLEGMGDDPFNISTHTKRLEVVETPTRIKVRQAFVLQHMPIIPGYEVVAADRETGQIVGSAQVLSVQTIPNADPERAPREVLTLDKSMPGLNTTHQIWQPAFSNPDNMLIGCRILKSCRMQSNVVIDSCDITAFLWCYSENIEGPGPESVIIRDSILRRGRGNTSKCLTIEGMSDWAANDPLPRRLQTVVVENCDIYGHSEVIGADGVRLTNLAYLDPGYPSTGLLNNQSVTQN